MAERISRRLVLLSSAAIGAVYLTGYLGTEATDASLAGSPPSELSDNRHNADRPFNAAPAH